MNTNIKHEESDKFTYVASITLLSMMCFIPVVGLPDVVQSLTSTIPVERIGDHSNRFLILIRDLLALSAFLVTIWGVYMRKVSLPRVAFAVPLFLIVVISFFRSASFHLAGSIIGLRVYQYLPLFVLVTHCVKKNPKFASAVSRVMVGIVTFEFIIAILQSQFMSFWEGRTFFGARTIGSFNNPNALGIFCSIAFFYFLFAGYRRAAYYLPMLAMIVLTCLTSGSRTAIATIFIIGFLFLFIKASRRIKVVFGILGCVSFAYLLTHIGALAGRQGIPGLHHDPRVRFFFEQVHSMSDFDFIFGMGNGVRSNIVFTMSLLFPKFFDLPYFFISAIPESQVIASIAQIGLLGFVVFNCMLIKLLSLGRAPGFILYMIIALVSISNVWLELYPFNFLCVMFAAIIILREQDLCCKSYLTP